MLVSLPGNIDIRSTNWDTRSFGELGKWLVNQRWQMLGHTPELVELTLDLAAAMGFAREQLPQFHSGVILHDIGKMVIPDHILLKSEELTAKEREIIQQHPGNAYRLLSQVLPDGISLDIIHYHHEKWDGSGYPHGLAGDQIPLAARVFTAVDVWNALSLERPYRPAWPKVKIVRYFMEQRGRYFDPAVVDAFLGLVV
ncbi:MAG: HD domain-containing protein [Anaerolineae bacterium]|nr:HD domain-containing protein [Anaerolineae bacterium]